MFTFLVKSTAVCLTGEKKRFFETAGIDEKWRKMENSEALEKMKSV